MRKSWVLLVAVFLAGGFVGSLFLGPRHDKSYSQESGQSVASGFGNAPKILQPPLVLAQATHLQAIPLALGQSTLAQDFSDFAFLDDDNFRWDFERVYRARSKKLRIRMALKTPLAEDEKLQLAHDAEPPIDFTAEADKKQFTITKEFLPPGRRELVIQVQKAKKDDKDKPPVARPLQQFSVIFPRTGPTPQIDAVSNGLFIAEVSPPPRTVQLFDGFLRLRIATAIGRERKLEFFMLAGDGTFKVHPVANAQTRKSADAISSAVLHFDRTKLGPLEHALIVRMDDGDDHAFSEKISFRSEANTIAAADPPVFPALFSKLDRKDAPLGNSTTAESGEILLNTTRFDITGSLGQGVKPDARVLVFTASPEDPIAIGTITGTNWTAKVRDKLGEGRHRLFAVLAQGDIVSKKISAPVDIFIKTRGPQVQGVIPPNFGTAPGVQKLTIKFNPENTLEGAPNAAALVLEPSGGTGVFDRGLSGPTPGTPGFDKITNAVTLSFTNLVPDLYRLTIKGSMIKDVFGNFLEGKEGVPGSDFVLVLSKPDEECRPGELPSLSRGITMTTGPNAVFPRFLEPKDLPAGFNPSDHVETRVARLYYFRDAHRVAQIINRDVKSFNRQGVEMRRRLADSARDKANVFTDERRAQERRAVQAATETREAERLLKQEQEALRQSQERGLQAGQAAQNADRSAALLQTRLSAETAAEQAAAEQVQKTAGNPSSPEAVKAREDLKQASTAVEFTRKQLEQAAAVKGSAATAGEAEAQNIGVLQARVKAAQDNLQVKRSKEVEENEKALHATATEDRAREEQFRREVAAAHEDPDTYVPGKIDSVDPVLQVSISVIGESELQLRGPIGGINVIREMINQIDAPAGQVRIAVHTVQVNGERAERMEKVIGRIQSSIDHSRFLTQQSALMLRKAVVKVASRRAYEMQLVFPGDTQEARDWRYLNAFFGADFINELRAQDSEFLRSGNKLLSLHSMDTTSLASALFVLALAKNTTRMEILREFQEMLRAELPQAEMAFYEAAGCVKPGGNIKPGAKHKLMLLANNARFQSFLGFFNAELAGDDTLSPLQREFIRLAQIFKSRLITELEVKQRVMERALIEERLGNYKQELLDAKKKEQDANAALANIQATVLDNRVKVTSAFAPIAARVKEIREADDELAEDIGEDLASFKVEKDDLALRLERMAAQAVDEVKKKELRVFSKDLANIKQQDRKSLVLLQEKVGNFAKEISPKDADALIARSQKRRLKFADGRVIDLTKMDGGFRFDAESDAVAWNAMVVKFENYGRQINAYTFPHHQKTFEDARQLVSEVRAESKFITDGTLVKIQQLLGNLSTLSQVVVEEGARINARILEIVAELSSPKANIADVFNQWIRLRQRIVSAVKDDLRKEALERFAVVDASFAKLLELNVAHENARRTAAESRRPLDHKKLLDMLIDEIQDKYVELLEGTRAHTANIDDYIKRVATALEDDFNTQFYLPAFRDVREAARGLGLWDVTLSAIETTSILTNNRTYAKVEPQATMEFDLPRRDILITEAMRSAKGLIDTYGALTQDPTFLSLVKMGAGMPTSSPGAGTTGGLTSVRNVLPGLGRQTDEQAMSQFAAGGKSFGTPLDSLVPDPAIYKFETGTGYEIRPVIQPDGQSVVFHFNYMYTTNIREPVRADEKHLGRVKRHFIDTNVQLGNYELREISKYQVALRAARTARGVPLLEDIPGVGTLFRPLPSAESSLQQNIILGQSVIYPTLFDLMGLRWAPAVADLDPLRLTNDDFIVRNRRRYLMNRVFDFSSSKVDEALRIPEGERRGDLYRTQETIPYIHPNGYQGPGMGLRDSRMQEGYDPKKVFPDSRFVPGTSPDGHLNPNADVERRQREQSQREPSLAPPYGPPNYYIPSNQVPPGMPGLPPGLAPGMPPGLPRMEMQRGPLPPLEELAPPPRVLPGAPSAPGKGVPPAQRPAVGTPPRTWSPPGTWSPPSPRLVPPDLIPSTPVLAPAPNR